ncbi:bifunctional 2',3'-cyclic-nucleotide 2'-phosphodiesterase/3'-nucleotidase [Utexia brackfieldae]|uniref:bifunctional 2',3'-cyclic-nucleotide 2'-phosphodiesterase/3'-nucleotidase n=1 Tax=Utexia brackfieldae TaxID=3074108 RepID=UPI00370D32B1
MKKRVLSFIIGLSMTQVQAVTVDLRIMETSDIHANMMDYDFYKEATTPRYGFTRTAALIRQAQTEKHNFVLVDNGDLIQGSPMGDWAFSQPSWDKLTHPAIKALNSLQYTVGGLGNHEFNYGLPFLDSVIKGAQYPYINANVFDLNTKQPYFTPYVILDKPVTDRAGQTHSLKIGYISFVPPQIMQWDKNNLSDKVYTNDITETARQFVPQMKAAGADIIIAIAHSGLSTDPYKLMAENSVYYLSTVKDIDAILFGHTHSLFPGPSFAHLTGIDNQKGHVNGIPAVMPGQWGDHLGMIDLTLTKTDQGWQVIDSVAQTRAIFDTVNSRALVDADPQVSQILADDFKQTRQYMNTVIGKTASPLFSDLALVQDDATIKLINLAQIDYIQSFIQGDPDLADLPVISAVAPFKAGSRKNDPSAYIEIPAGELTVKSANDLYVYANTLAAITLTGRDLKAWLECSAGVFNQIDIENTAPQYLINWAHFRLFNFDIIEGGITYEIDVTKPPRYNSDCQLINDKTQRIEQLTYQGKPLDEDQKFIMAMNNYRAFTGIFPGSGEQHVVINSPDPVKEILARYIAKQTADNGAISVPLNHHWQISEIHSPLKLDIRVETSPTEAAKIFIQEQAQYPMTFISNDSTGYAVYRLDLQNRK